MVLSPFGGLFQPCWSRSDGVVTDLRRIDLVYFEKPPGFPSVRQKYQIWLQSGYLHQMGTKRYKAWRNAMASASTPCGLSSLQWRREAGRWRSFTILNWAATASG